MKYVNPLKQIKKIGILNIPVFITPSLIEMIHLKTLILISLIASLVACGSAPVKKDLLDLSTPRDLEPTLEYIPVTETDKEGKPIPYVPSVNPYMLQKGKIKKDSAVKFIEAKRAISAKNYQKANSLLDDLTASDDSLSGPWLLKGDLAVKQEKLDDAVSYYAKAIEVNDKNVNAYLRLAHLQRQQGKFLIAQNTYTEALKTWKDFPEAHLNIAVLYDLYLNHPIRAQRHLEAYQFLTGEEDLEVGEWLKEIKSRTGIVTTLKSIVADNGEVIKPGAVIN